MPSSRPSPPPPPPPPFTHTTRPPPVPHPHPHPHPLSRNPCPHLCSYFLSYHGHLDLPSFVARRELLSHLLVLVCILPFAPTPLHLTTPTPAPPPLLRRRLVGTVAHADSISRVSAVSDLRALFRLLCACAWCRVYRTDCWRAGGGCRGYEEGGGTQVDHGEGGIVLLRGAWGSSARKGAFAERGGGRMEGNGQ